MERNSNSSEENRSNSRGQKSQNEPNLERGALGNKEVSNRHKCPDCDGLISKESNKSKSRVWKRVMWFTRRGKSAKNDICHCRTNEVLNPSIADRHSNSWSFTRRASRKFRASSRRRQCKAESSKKSHEKQDEARAFCDSSQPSTCTGSACSSNPNSPTATGSFCDFGSGNAGGRGSKHHKNSSVLTEIAREINPPIKNNVLPPCDYVQHPPKQLSKSVSLVNYISCRSPTFGHVRRSKSFPGSQSCISPSKRRFINIANKTFSSFSPPLKQKCYGLQHTATFCGKMNAEFPKPCMKKSKSLNTTELTRLEKTTSLGEIRDQSGSVVGIVHFYKSPKKMLRRMNSLNHEVKKDSAIVEDECEIHQSSLNSAISNLQDGNDCHLNTKNISSESHRTLSELSSSNKSEKENMKGKTMLYSDYPSSLERSKISKNLNETSQLECSSFNDDEPVVPDVECEQNNIACLKISRMNSNHNVDRLIQCVSKDDVSSVISSGVLSTRIDGEESVISGINSDKTAMTCSQQSDECSNKHNQLACEDEENVNTIIDMKSTIDSNGMQVEKSNIPGSQMYVFCSDQNKSTMCGNQCDILNSENDLQESFLDLVDNVVTNNVKGASTMVHERSSVNGRSICTSLDRSDTTDTTKFEKVSQTAQFQCPYKSCMTSNLVVEQPLQRSLEDVKLSCYNHISDSNSLGSHHYGDSIGNSKIPCHCDKSMSDDCDSSDLFMKNVCLSSTLNNDSKNSEEFEFQTGITTLSDVESVTGSVTNSCSKDVISFDYEPEFTMSFDEDALNTSRCSQKYLESKTVKRKQSVDTVTASDGHDRQVVDNIKLNHSTREFKLSHKMSNSCIDHELIEVPSNTCNSPVTSIESERAHRTKESPNDSLLCESVAPSVLHLQSQEEFQTNSHSNVFTSLKTPISETERSQEVVECPQTSDYASMFDACFSPPQKEDIPIHTWKTSESDLKSEEIAQPVPGETFKMRTELMLTWFKEFNDEQRNIILKKILNRCELPQMHLLSVAMENNLHKTCPPNCQDMLVWLPYTVTLKILMYLDPVSLCRCGQVNRAWNELANNPLIWQRLNRNPDYQLSEACSKRQYQKFNQPNGEIHWKKVFAERFLLQKNWLNGKYKLRTFEGHNQGIACVQFDDTRIVSGSSDKTIKLWDISNTPSELMLTLEGHSGTVRCLDLNGNRLVSGSTDRTIKVWDLSFASYWAGASCKVTMVGHLHTVRCLQADEKKLVSGSYDKTVKVWDLKTGDCQLTLRGHTAAVLCVQFDEQKIVSGSYDKKIKVWDLAEGICLMTLDGHQDAVTCLNLTHDGMKIITGSLDYSLKFWDLSTGKCYGTLDWITSEGHTAVVRCLQVDSWRIVSGGDDKTLKVWELATGQRLLTLRYHSDGVTCMQFNDFAIVSGSYDRTVKLWDFTPKHSYLEAVT
ncbi:uncharacterized protein LOC114521707 [Dendronephthya gigantea]|uniref:uncharacterized protein LOC114521707 n=1 Tax=Dendronephthya gigantea TaxID=151771 RepID=UPI00106A4938|nr:uncharacterized protein LOC114521707 [Dendronephthya gigantea]